MDSQIDTLYLATSPMTWPSPAGRWIPMAQREMAAGGNCVMITLHPCFSQLTEKRGQVSSVPFEYVGQMHVAEDLDGNRINKGGSWLIKVATRSAISMLRRGIELRPKRIVLCKPQPINGLAALAIRAMTGSPIDLDCDDYERASNHFGSGLGARINQFVVLCFERMLPRVARKISVNTRFMAEKCVEWGASPKRIVIEPNGVWDAPSREWLSYRRIELRTAFKLGNSFVISYVGAMSTVAHSVDMLLQAFKHVVYSEPDTLLYMVGSGPEVADLRALADRLGISHAVKWIGPIPRAQRWDYFAIADCTVDPVRDTPGARARSPLKIYESLSVGVPVVTAKVGDRNLIDSPLLVFGLPTVEGLAKALLKVKHSY